MQIKVENQPDGNKIISWVDPHEPCIILYWFSREKEWRIRSPWGERIISAREAVIEILCLPSLREVRFIETDIIFAGTATR